VDVVREDSFGVALWSRVPLAGATTWPLDGLPQAEGTLRIGAGNVTIWSVHVLPPRNAEYWKAHAAEVDLLATAVENETRSLVVTGDFNAPAFSPFHHRMLRTLNDAWNLAGAGYGATWPNGVFPLPPLRLDHIYLSPDLTVTAIRIGTGAHSDHRPLVAELAPRAGGGLCPG
jgi:endonuclease/exonuclease/phosphatase (EEP) superfamily protein YafD